MSWWTRILTGEDEAVKPKRLDYLNEGLALERQGDYEGAVTSYHLALRDQPNNVKVLQYIAIALSRTGRREEAIRHYRKALEIAPDLAGAHYGLGFLLLKRGDTLRAGEHLRTFLSTPPRDPEMAQWVDFARQALARIDGERASLGTPVADGEPA
ncbi:MAG TPA: tetratricopeptide repeat protein [Gemmatimonadales bacterium]|jgi:Flp pilus assembly protein TadD|nr:tetratricopeptide repeat protein [Gemmatimonadales bacterium]